MLQVKAPRLLHTAYTIQQVPPPLRPEVLVLGRSNVGKSSLLNALLGGASSSSSSSSGLAHVSATPGRTSSINLYRVNHSWCLTDCPGYGYARRSQEARADWHAMTQAYLKQRSKQGMLADVLLLIDASLPPRETDLAGVDWLASLKLPLTLVYTKCDKRKRGQPTAAENIAGFRAALDRMKLLQPAQFPTCSVGGAGSRSSSRFGQRELLLYLARRVAAHMGLGSAAAAGPTHGEGVG